MIVNFNGRFCNSSEARVAINDSGFLFGDTLFETLKARDGRILFRDAHLDRLQLSAGLLDFPLDVPAVNGALARTLERLEWPVARLRLTVSRGPAAGLEPPPREHGWFAVTAAEYREPAEGERRHGVSCCLAPNQRVNPLSHLPQMKRGNYADCLYAARHARRLGFREAIFVDEKQGLLEAATSNLFLIMRETLLTPPAGELVLAGVMRRQVLQCAADHGLGVREEPIPLSILEKCDGAFLTNSLIDILPIRDIEGRALPLGELPMQLLEMIREEARQKDVRPEGRA